MNMRPKIINILGIPYRIIYFDQPAEVDTLQRQMLDGQIDFWTRTIRVHDSGQPDEHIWQVLMHEVLHGIVNALHLDILAQERAHDDLDCLALGLVDVIFRNGWIPAKKKIKHRS